MIVEFVAADAVRDLRDASAPTTTSGFGTANSVAAAKHLLKRMVLGANDNDSSWATTGTAAAATTSRKLTYTSDDESSIDTRRDRKKKSKSKAKDDRD